MAKVTMAQTTRADGVAYEAGQEYEVDDATAERWLELGIASKASGKAAKADEPDKPPAPAPKQTTGESARGALGR